MSQLKRQSCGIVWLACSTAIARKRYIKRNKNSATYFDNQIKDIEQNEDKIAKDLNPKIIDVLNKAKTNKTMEQIYSEFNDYMVYYAGYEE